MEGDIHIDVGGREGRIFLALDSLISVYMVIYNRILLLALDTLVSV